MCNKLAIFLILIFIGSPVYAQETNFSEPGIKPGSLFYGLDKALEWLELYFTEGHSNKARVHLKHSQERLAEAMELSAEGDVSGAEEAFEGYDEAIDSASLEVMVAELAGEDVSYILRDVVKSYERRSAVLEIIIENSPISDRTRISEKFDLTDVLEKVELPVIPVDSEDTFSVESDNVFDVPSSDIVATPEEVDTQITTVDSEELSSPDLETIEVIVTEAEGALEEFDDAVEETDDGIKSEADTMSVELTDGSSTIDTSVGSRTAEEDSQSGDTSSGDTSGGSSTGGGDSQGGDASSGDTSGGSSTGGGGSGGKGNKGGKGGDSQGGDSQGGDSQGEDEQ